MSVTKQFVLSKGDEVAIERRVAMRITSGSLLPRSRYVLSMVVTRSERKHVFVRKHVFDMYSSYSPERNTNLYTHVVEEGGLCRNFDTIYMDGQSQHYTNLGVALHTFNEMLLSSLWWSLD